MKNELRIFRGLLNPSHWALLPLLVAFAVLLVAQAASAGNCIPDKFGKKLTCTANDIQIAKALNPRDLSGNSIEKCIEGQVFSFIADFQVVTTATSRYDIGLWFSTDGHGGADTSGTCSVNMIKGPYLDQAGQHVMLGAVYAADLDGDACGDVNTANGWGPPDGRLVTVRVDNVTCKAGKTGNLSLPNCTSWSQNVGGICLTPDDTTPGSPSKCNCDAGFEVPIKVDMGKGTATKDPTPISLPEPGGEFTYNISFTSSSEFVSVTLDRICDDRYGTIAYWSGPPCDEGSEGSINSTDCAAGLPPTLIPNATFSCSFKANFKRTNIPGNSVSLTDTVTFFGHDSNPNPNPVKQTAAATVMITDIPPAGTISKWLDSMQCAVVRYKVKAVNSNPDAGALRLTKLMDSSFGDITAAASSCDIKTVSNCVKSTTCNLGAGVFVGETPYECQFDGYFCGTEHTNQITATWDDGYTEDTPSSNMLTVKVSADTK